MLNLSATPRGFRGFTVSTLLHCFGGWLLLSAPRGRLTVAEEVALPHYAVQRLQLESPRYVPLKMHAAPAISRDVRVSASVLAPMPDLRATEKPLQFETGGENQVNRSGPARAFAISAFVQSGRAAETRMSPEVPPDLLPQQVMPVADLLLKPDLNVPPKQVASSPKYEAPEPARVFLPAPPQTDPSALLSVDLLAVAPGKQSATGESEPGDAVQRSGIGPRPDSVKVMPGLGIRRGAGGADVGPALPGRGVAANATGTHAPDGSESLRPAQQEALAGTATLTRPPDGAFGVVVLGAAAAALYPEASGALGGRRPYTVYLRVGQRKNWILQYCAPTNAVAGDLEVATAVALDAPWPYTMVRPVRSLDIEYILVHGFVTEAGQFDELSLVFPKDFDGKTLLLSSLRQWKFRPARLAGQNARVEILLIIPRQTE